MTLAAPAARSRLAGRRLARDRPRRARRLRCSASGRASARSMWPRSPGTGARAALRALDPLHLPRGVLGRRPRRRRARRRSPPAPGSRRASHFAVLAAVLALIGVGAVRFLLPPDADDKATEPRRSRGRRGPIARARCCRLLHACSPKAPPSTGAPSTSRTRSEPRQASRRSAYTAFSLAMTASRTVGDRLNRRLGPVTLARSGAVARDGRASGLALAIGSVPVAIAGFAAMGAGLGVVVPVLFRAAGLDGDASRRAPASQPFPRSAGSGSSRGRRRSGSRPPRPGSGPRSASSCSRRSPSPSSPAAPGRAVARRSRRGRLLRSTVPAADSHEPSGASSPGSPLHLQVAREQLGDRLAAREQARLAVVDQHRGQARDGVVGRGHRLAVGAGRRERHEIARAPAAAGRRRARARRPTRSGAPRATRARPPARRGGRPPRRCSARRRARGARCRPCRRRARPSACRRRRSCA